VKVTYRHQAEDDLIRQFRYYLVTMDVPKIAIRFRRAVGVTVEALRQHPFKGPHYPLRNPRLQNLRSWPVAGFAAIRIYYIAETGSLRLIRILHEKRDVRRILEKE